MSTKLSNENDLSFLKNKELSKIIEDSIQYIQIIFEESDKKESALYKEETYRVILLYVTSIIEAILLRVLELRKETIPSIDYKYTSPVNKQFKHVKLPKDTVVIAVQQRSEKDNKRIGLVELVNYMKNNDLVEEKIIQEILDINDIRNTFHFTKPRDQITFEIKTIEKAFELLVKIIQKAPAVLKIKGKTT
ncbi:MAG: hypothetical protein WC862_00775 [Patescibacteria group bacterium]